MKKLSNLNDALITKLKALYDIENQLVRALPKMAKKSTDPDLKRGFEMHLKETKGHVSRLEQCFNLLNLKPGKEKSEAVRGLAKDAEWIMSQKPEKQVLDSMLIAAASYVEHYEIAGYMAAIRWATYLGYGDIADLLKLTLKEEQSCADALEYGARKGIDEAAMAND